MLLTIGADFFQSGRSMWVIHLGAAFSLPPPPPPQYDNQPTVNNFILLCCLVITLARYDVVWGVWLNIILWDWLYIHVCTWSSEERVLFLSRRKRQRDYPIVVTSEWFLLYRVVKSKIAIQNYPHTFISAYFILWCKVFEWKNTPLYGAFQI